MFTVSKIQTYYFHYAYLNSLLIRNSSAVEYNLITLHFSINQISQKPTEQLIIDRI